MRALLVLTFTCVLVLDLKSITRSLYLYAVLLLYVFTYLRHHSDSNKRWLKLAKTWFSQGFVGLVPYVQYPIIRLKYDGQIWSNIDIVTSIHRILSWKNWFFVQLQKNGKKLHDNAANATVIVFLCSAHWSNNPLKSVGISVPREEQFAKQRKLLEDGSGRC